MYDGLSCVCQVLTERQEAPLIDFLLFCKKCVRKPPVHSDNVKNLSFRSDRRMLQVDKILERKL